MRRYKEEVLTLDTYQVMRNVRSNLAEQIQTYWCGKPTSNVGMQYLSYKEGVITASQHVFERTDILWIAVDNVCNVFIEPDGSVQIDRYRNVELTTVECDQLKKLAAKVYAANVKYVEREKQFLDAKPWLQVHGMMPEEAVAKFTELGWGPKEVE